MKKLPFKTLMLTSAVALCLTFPESANAQTESVGATLTTSSAITTVDVSDMSFGTFMIIFGAPDTPQLTLTDDGTITVTQTGGAIPNSIVTQLVAPASEGGVTVQIPAPAVLTMTRSGSVDFVDPGLSLSAATYRTATENGNINADAANGPVTVVAGGVAEAVAFGGVIDVTATPTDGVHTASFDVTFSF